jgi:hypothetical protein
VTFARTQLEIDGRQVGADRLDDAIAHQVDADPNPEASN